MAKQKVSNERDPNTFSGLQKTMGRRVNQVEKETAQVERLGRVRFRCIDNKGGYDGMRIINEGEVFDFPVALLETRDQHEENVQIHQLREVRDFIEIEGVEYVVPKWVEPAPEESGEMVTGHTGIHGNAGTAIA